MAIRHGPSDILKTNITTDGLVFYINPHISACWDGSSNTINDLSLGGLTCTASNVTRSPGGYFNFNGSNSIINTNSQLIDTGTYSISSSTDDYTLEAWIYVRTSQGTTTDADSIIGSQGSYGVGMQVGISGSVPRINHGARSTSNFYSNTFSYNQWRHIVWSHDHGVGSTVYHNGASNTTSSGASYDIASTSSAWGNMTIGNSSSRVTGYYDGWMGAIRVYNRAITAAEALRNYNADKARYGL